MTSLRNALTVPIRVLDVTLNGVSVLAAARQEWLRTGRLEDAEDDLTVLPGESLAVGEPDPQAVEHWTWLWLEGDAPRPADVPSP